jgi:hypothetical protein
MAKEDKPLEYQRRIRDTKGVAQRLDLGYLQRESWLLLLRKRATWLAAVVVALACVPLVIGIGGTRRMVESGPLSDAHAMFETQCQVCHTQAFGGVPDKACGQCHDGAAHPAKSIDTAVPDAAVRCAECHQEHRGKVRLAEVGNSNCTRCHSDLASHAKGVKIHGAQITAFRAGAHPEFSSATAKDVRPIKLNHAVHMPAQAKTIREIKLPMQCVDCHVSDKTAPDARLLPVTFEQNCKSCHARELEFDVYHVGVPPAPHAKDTKVIHEWIVAQYRPLSLTPLPRRPLGNDLVAQPSAAAWLDRVVKDSEAYLFERKCVYCHVGPVSTPPKVGVVAAGQALPRGEFNHRAHRAVQCDECHTQARTSTLTSDVLIPAMKSCTPCHGGSGTKLDHCTTCHQYHNRNLEKDHARPVRELIGRAVLP